MRVAFFSPLPPRKSGIADYSAALLAPLARLVEVEVFADSAAGFDPTRFDIALYQVGNNGHHALAYETALRHPGVVVLHEANLHHLVADLTIRRGDWDGYLEAVAYEAGPEALAYARRVRALEVGPDYEGVPMLRRLAQAARAFIVHSRFVEGKLREAGFTGPVARIPHGAWTGGGDRLAYRRKLGLSETLPLIGILGFLKPYKRIAESLRAFRRLLRLQPEARLILTGEEHPELPLDSLIDSLELAAAVRRLGFTPLEDFTGYLAACDIVLNLRYPTVGETSGTLQRALGMGKAVIVSDVGAFSELPDEICLKVPVDACEEDLLFEYLNLLVSRPDLRRRLGDNARRWAERECSWERVARLYCSFLDAVLRGEEWESPSAPRPPAPPAAPVVKEDILDWTEADTYVEAHLSRLEQTLAITPAGGPGDRILEMGAYLQITPALHTKLGYGEVRGCYYGPAGRSERKTVVSASGETFTCDIDLFDAERDRFPYPDGHFATVLCCELIEHLAADPMHMMSEINRVLRPGGWLVLTTPNAASLRAVAAILQGYHPGFFPAYLRPPAPGAQPEPRHSREYTPKEIARLLLDAGFEVARLETGPFREAPKPELAWVEDLLERYGLPADLRGDCIYAVGRKVSPVLCRYPDWLYS